MVRPTTSQPTAGQRATLTYIRVWEALHLRSLINSSVEWHDINQRCQLLDSRQRAAALALSRHSPGAARGLGCCPSLALALALAAASCPAKGRGRGSHVQRQRGGQQKVREVERGHHRWLVAGRCSKSAWRVAGGGASVWVLQVRAGRRGGRLAAPGSKCRPTRGSPASPAKAGLPQQPARSAARTRTCVSGQLSEDGQHGGGDKGAIENGGNADPVLAACSPLARVARGLGGMGWGPPAPGRVSRPATGAAAAGAQARQGSSSSSISSSSRRRRSSSIHSHPGRRGRPQRRTAAAAPAQSRPAP